MVADVRAGGGRNKRNDVGSEDKWRKGQDGWWRLR